MKTCSKCKETKPKSEFYKSKKSKDGLQSRCNSCNKATVTEWYREDPERAREKNLKTNYGLTVAKYEAILKSQGGKCKICSTTSCDTGRRFAVDHCHTSGKIRGLLCQNCNTALGGFKDRVRVMLKGMLYLLKGRLK